MREPLAILATVQIEPTEMVLEFSGGRTSFGKHPSNMILWKHRSEYGIQWTILNLDRVVEIGLVFEDKTLVDYDGVLSLSEEAIKLIRAAGFIVPKELEP